MPASQRKEDYPKDYAGKVTIAQDAAPGVRYWRVSTSQGVTPSMQFVVGDLPEVIEKEIDGAPIPVHVTLPVTINGRIFPREDVDEWTFEAKTGQLISCEVMASRIGSALDSRLEIRSPRGLSLVENVDAFGTDSYLYFLAPENGTYTCRIHDINYGGLQHYVYRLSIRPGPVIEAVYPLGGKRGSETALQLAGFGLPAESLKVAVPDSGSGLFDWQYRNGTDSTRLFRLQAGDAPESLESEPNNEVAAEKTIQQASVPSFLNGRIDEPGDFDLWEIAADEGKTLQFEVFAARLGTDLDSVLSIQDATGKQLATNDDLKGGISDSRLSWKIPKGGPFFLKIRDQLASRGGARFAYRVAVTEPDPNDFQLFVDTDAFTVPRGGEVKVKVTVQRSPGITGEIELAVEGLPESITVENTKIAKGKPNTQVTFKATGKEPVAVHSFRITGRALDVEPEVVRTASMNLPFGRPPLTGFALAVAMPTPFKFTAPFATRYASRGTIYSRNSEYTIERGGYEGPIEIELADRQARHLQGVTGPRIIVPPGESKFSYSVTLPPWMEIGRTSRSCLQASAFVEDENGTKHRVCYSSQAQDDQLIILVDPVRLSVESPRQSIGIQPGDTIDLPIKVNRGPGLKGAVDVRIKSARHVLGWEAAPVRIEDGKGDGVIQLKFDANDPGPFNMPLVIEAKIADDRGLPVTGEFRLDVRRLDLVAEPQ